VETLRRILLITPFAPSRAARHGCPRVVCGLAGALADRHELIILHLGEEDAIDQDLAARCEVRLLPSRSRSRWGTRAIGAGGLLRGRSLWASELGISRIQRAVAALGTEFDPDIVQVEHGVLGEALAGAGRRPIRVVTMHETAASVREFLAFRREGLALAHRVDVSAAIRQERRVLSVADAAVAFSDSDRLRLADHTVTPSAEIVTIRVGCELPPAPLDPGGAEPPVLLFFGSFVHPPNIDAAIRMAQSIFPLIREARPDVTLEIVGDSPPPEVRALGGDKITVTGSVTSIVPYLDRAAVVVAPIEIGGGVRVKVLEALAAGKAVAASARAAEGISARPGEEMMIAEGNLDMAAAIVALLEDERARRALAQRAREWALRELTWSAMADRYDELYANLAARRRADVRARA
jgi:polysaccharide biosynthesis protein PslH